MIALSSTQLHGFIREKAECYGKPHVLATYTGSGVKSYRHADAPCPLCHRLMVSNTHHQPDRHTFTLKTPLGIHELRPALFGLCGSGTFGCHGKVERGDISITWQWLDDEFAAAWWDGRMLGNRSPYEGIVPHSPRLYQFGGWRVEDKRTGSVRLLLGGDVQ